MSACSLSVLTLAWCTTFFLTSRQTRYALSATPTKRPMLPRGWSRLPLGPLTSSTTATVVPKMYGVRPVAKSGTSARKRW